MTFRRPLLTPLLAGLAMAQGGPSVGEPLGREAGRAQETDPRDDRGDLGVVPRTLHAGADARVLGDEGVVLGTIRDHVLDLDDARVTHAVLHTAARTVLVPFELLTFEAEGEPTLALDAAQVAALPAFVGRSAQSDTHAAGANATIIPTGPRGESVTPPLLATRARTCAVLADEEPCGSVRGLVVDPCCGRLRFVFVATKDEEIGESPIVVPWSALRYRMAPEPDERDALVLDKSCNEMLEAPRIDPKATRSLQRPELAGAIHAFYGTTLPSHELHTTPQH